jgi:hypothetical protein
MVEANGDTASKGLTLTILGCGTFFLLQWREGKKLTRSVNRNHGHCNHVWYDGIY